MSGETILVVDDEPSFVGAVSATLKQAGYQAIGANDGMEALRMLYEKRPHLVILDVKFPTSKIDGMGVCSRIREVSDVPIIMLTGQEQPDDMVRGLDAGADDYMVKPYNQSVLLARVRANLRRAATPPPLQYSKNGILYHDSYLTVNLDERRVLCEGRQIKLSPTEFKLLVMLIQAAPKVVNYKDLLQGVWGLEYINDIDYLRVYMWHLRRKIEPDAKQPTYLCNELGVGYRFEKQI